MKNSKWLVVALAAAVIAAGLFTIRLQAAGPLARSGPSRGKLLEKAKEKLDLTDEQVAQIKNQFKSEKENITGLLTRMHEARSGLRAAIQTTGANEESVRAAASKVGAVEADAAVERLKLFGKLSSILTAEQRGKLSDLQGQMDEFVQGAIERVGGRLAD